MDVDGRLTAHLRAWLGEWPSPTAGLTVVGSARRTEPGWDGVVRPVAGVTTPAGGVLSVPPDAVDAVLALGDALEAGIAAAVGHPGWVFARGVFRTSVHPTPGDDPGVWLPNDDPRLPEWLRPFNGDVLVGFADGPDGPDGPEVAAGVGRKIHDEFGHELAVVTEPGHQGRGWARRLVTQAARRILADGAVPTYLHAPSNTASARTAVASGFPDLGWQVLGLFPGRP